MNRTKTLLTLCLVFLAARAPAQTEWIEKLDQALHVESAKGWFQADLSGLADFEGYVIDGNPPGLLFNEHDFLFNPRLSLFLDIQLGPHLYTFVQTRFDRGFDPGVDPDGDVRLDEYFLRYTPLDDARINLQFGKFATVVGNWIQRHDSWRNPFITAPVPYENVIVISDQTVPGGPAAFLARRDRVDQKVSWLPILWGPSYATGGSIFGRLETFEYAFEIKNASISSRPSIWEATELGWEYPTLSGRLGYRPSPTWSFGASASYGAYLLPAARTTLGSGRSLGDYQQITIGTDAAYAWRHWQVWAEVFASRFEVPNVGNADTLAYYIEAKYEFAPHWFGALRWNQQIFDDVPDGAGGRKAWDRDLWRVDAAMTYRFDRHLQAKLQYSYSHQRGHFQQGEQLVAAQITVKF